MGVDFDKWDRESIKIGARRGVFGYATCISRFMRRMGFGDEERYSALLTYFAVAADYLSDADGHFDTGIGGLVR